jgi:hypothetical protein
MTKQQAIKALVKIGWTNIRPEGRFSIWATSPAGQVGLFNGPRELLADIARGE